MAEMAIISARKARLTQLANEGDKNAKIALELANNPNNFLSTVQIGITSVSILLGIFGGSAISVWLDFHLSKIDLIAPYSNGISIAIVVIGITYLSLIIGELVPKRFALSNPEKIARIVARPMLFISQISYPLVYLLSKSTDFTFWLLRVKNASAEPITEEEIKVLMEEGTQSGAFEEAEQDMVESIFRIGDQKVSAIMTPRPDLQWIDINDPMSEIKEMIKNSIHSRFPVSEGDLDKIIGIVQVKDLIGDSFLSTDPDIKKHLKKPLLIPETMHIFKLLEVFKQSGMHMAIVVDEYGGIEGIVSLNDILESIVGDLPSDDEIEPEIIEREDGSYLVDGTFSIDDFKDFFEIDKLPDEEKHNYQSIGGFVMAHLAKIPEVSEKFEVAELSFEIMDMDGNRIDKILVTRLEKDNEEEKN